MRWQAVVLAAGYGIRMRSDLERDKSGLFSGLAATAKPLLPVGGRLLVEWWLDAFEDCGFEHAVIVTNELFVDLFHDLAAVREEHHHHRTTRVTVLSDRTDCEPQRLGAIGDLALGLQALSAVSIAEDAAVLVVAGDTLLVGTELREVVASFESVPSTTQVGVVGYELDDLSDATRRGMLRVAKSELDGSERVTELVEKPTSVEGLPSRTASMPIYFYRQRDAAQLVQTFLKEREDRPIDEMDAPGLLLAWLLEGVQGRPPEVVALVRAAGRIDVGGLEQYKDALDLLQQGGSDADPPQRMEQEVAIGRCLPRVGLLGNPSDGYGGRTISFLARNCGFAEATANFEPRAASSSASPHIRFVPDEICDLLTFADGEAELEQRTRSTGYAGGIRLVQAATVVFLRRLRELRAGRHVVGLHDLSFKVAYRTTIPAMVGLGGSSAIVFATLRCLCRLFRITESTFATSAEWPAIALSVERDELGIVGGLQDRISQYHGGIVYMDFHNGDEAVAVSSLDADRLPAMFLAFPLGRHHGRPSHAVHQPLRQRWIDGDEDVVCGMQELSALAEAGASLWHKHDQDSSATVPRSALADLMERNLQLRRRILPEKAIGESSLDMLAIATELDMAAKLSGSGGCVLCLPKSPSSFVLTTAQDSFRANGFQLLPVQIAPIRQPVSPSVTHPSISVGRKRSRQSPRSSAPSSPKLPK